MRTMKEQVAANKRYRDRLRVSKAFMDALLEEKKIVEKAKR